MRVLITGGGGVAPPWRLLIHNAMPKHALVTGAQRVRASARTVARSEPKAYLEPVGRRLAGLRVPRASRRSSGP
jgi:hypothetical protein